MSKLFQAEATIEGISTKKDRTLKLSIYTQELPPEDKAILFDLEQKQGWFLFKEEEMKEEDIPEETPEFKGQKSQAQRLRGVLYKLWEQNPPQYRMKYPFTLYYETKMEKIIDEYKEKINA